MAVFADYSIESTRVRRNHSLIVAPQLNTKMYLYFKQSGKRQPFEGYEQGYWQCIYQLYCV
jgi:hypothetical protein